MAFLDIEGALQWGDDCNENLHSALFSPLPSKKKKKKERTTAHGNVLEHKKLPQQLGGLEEASPHPKKIKGKSFEEGKVDGHDITLFQIHSKKAKRKSHGKEELSENEQIPSQMLSEKVKRKSLEKEDFSGKEQTPSQIHSKRKSRGKEEFSGPKGLLQLNPKKAKGKSLEKEQVGEHEVTEKKMKRKSLEKEDYNNSFKKFKQTDFVNGDDKSGQDLKVSTFTDKGQDAEHGRRKKRKRKPRNNKFEGWAKKGKSQPSEEVNGMEDKSLWDEGHGILWRNVDKKDPPDERKTGKGTDETGKEDLKVDRGSECYVEKEGGSIGEKKTRRKSWREDGPAGERKQDTKTEQNFKQKLSDSSKTSDEERKEQENNLARTEQNSADQKLPEEHPKIIYADEKKRGKGKEGLVGTAWEQQLRSARFRFINETLYSTSGAEAFKNFKGDKAAFEVYHEGYSQQVQQWPENPVDIIIKYLKRRPQSWIVGDFGCGEAQIAQSIHQKVLSFDIFRANEHVTVCNISKVPLRTESLDVAVYCLSLMGRNWPDYLREGNRVLKKGGILKIAEVASRFKSVDTFVNFLSKLGFSLKGKDLTNKMFYMFDFEKKKTCGLIPDKMADVLKPCKYKRR